MKIRHSSADDLERIMFIYDEGRKYMRENGNMDQWNDGYPQREVILKDIEDGISYVVEADDNEIIGVFAFMEGPDITYNKIYEGKWLDDRDYFVIHRIAVISHRKGVASFVYDWCLSKSDVIRIDTHRDNIPMRNSLKKNGFIYCGIIHLLSGDERLAFQKEKKI